MKYINFINIKQYIEDIKVKTSDKRIKNPNKFEHQVIKRLFCEKLKIRNVRNFLDEKNIHDVIQKNFYFQDILFNIFRKKIRKTDVALIMAFDFGRTGNRFNELRSFIQFGLSVGLNKIFLDSDDPMFFLSNNEYVLPVSKIPPYSIRISCKSAIFFHHLIWDLEINNYEKFERDADDVLRKIFLTDKIDRLNNKQMVIHIRGGDIFNMSNPPRDRHQPPFSWYVSVIKYHQDKVGIEQIIIVFEDNKNPCVDALIDYARKEKIDYQISSSSVEDDYRWLMGAKVLVPSWGTFCDPAISLNQDLEYVYRFSDDQIVPGAYITRGGWYATPSQVQLMIDLPLDCVIEKNIQDLDI